MKRSWSFVAAVVFLAAIVGCGEKQPQTSAGAASQSFAAGDAAAGKAVAEKYCQGCHGLDGRGTAPGIPTLAAQSERYLVMSVTEYKAGKRTHAALRDMTSNMTDAEVRNAVAFYASLPAAPASATRTPPLSPYDRGKQLSEACASCHNVDGNSVAPGVPTLAGQQPHYFVMALQEYHAGDRQTPALRSMLRVGTKLDVESLALYYSSQTPVRRRATIDGDAKAGEPLTGMCGGCHGVRGVSTDAATPNLAGQDAQYLFQATQAYGKTRKHEVMEGQVAKLSERDIRNIAAFYAAQEPRAAEKGHTLIQEIAAKCNRCHGSTENSAMAVPKLAGQDKNYLVMALRAYRDDRRDSSVMHRMSLPYSDAVIEGLADLYASQPAR